MSNTEDCAVLPKRIILHARAKENVPRRFIKDRKQLESVLGPSNPNWFEDASRRHVQQTTAPRSYESVIDSPLLTPRISQICMEELSVGGTPDGSSYSPKIVGRILSSQPCGSTPTYFKPVLGNSPCQVSPICLGLEPSQPYPTLAQSLGANVEESVLDWTNSLATPPGDGSGVGDQKSPADSGKTKEIARSLFSPSKKLDTSTDSVKPLDSTCEDESCDISADHSIQNKVNAESSGMPIQHDNKGEDQADDECMNSRNEISEINEKIDYEADKEPGIVVSGKTPEARNESDSRQNGVLKLEHCKRNSDFKMANCSPQLSSRTSSKSEFSVVSPLQNLIRADVRQTLNNSLNESSDCTDNEVHVCNSAQEVSRKKIVDCHGEQSPKHGHSNFITNKTISPAVSPERAIEVGAEILTSPTFSQKSTRKGAKRYTKNSSKDNRRYSIDSALSDFFDPPSSAVGRRRKPPQKRKSLEIDTFSELNISDPNIKCSTPKDTNGLQSILSAKSKEKKSNKKVRFSDDLHVSASKKVTVSFDDKIIEDYNYGSYCHENSEDDLKHSKSVSHSNETNVGNDTDKTAFSDASNQIETKKESLAIKNSNDADNEKNTADEKKEINVQSHSVYNRRKTSNQRLKTGKPESRSMLKNSVDNVDNCVSKAKDEVNISSETQEEFSQISPSSLVEMCSISDNVSLDLSTDIDSKSIKVEDCVYSVGSIKTHDNAGSFKGNFVETSRHDSHVEQNEKYLGSLNKTNAVKAPMKFFYPSNKQIATSCPKKVFEFKDDGIKVAVGLVKSVSVNDLIQKPEKIMEKEIQSKNIEMEPRSNTEAIENKQTGGEWTEVPNAGQISIREKPITGNSGTFAPSCLSEDNTKQDLEIFKCETLSSPAVERQDSKGFSKDYSTEHEPLQSRLSAPESLGSKSASENSIHTVLEKPQTLLGEENELKAHQFKSKLDTSGFHGFKLASGNSINLEEEALRKAEKLMNEDRTELDSSHMTGIRVSSQSIQKAQKLMNEDRTKLDSSHMTGIRVSSQSIQKAQKLMNEDRTKLDSSHMTGIRVSSQSIQKAQKLTSDISVFSKVNNPSRLKDDSLNSDTIKSNIVEMEEFENDSEFSGWFEEMEQAEFSSEKEKNPEETFPSKTIEPSKTNKQSKIFQECNLVTKLDENSIITSKEHIKTYEELPKLQQYQEKNVNSDADLDNDHRKNIDGEQFCGFMTAAGKKLKSSEAAVQNAEALLAEAPIKVVGREDKKCNKSSVKQQLNVDATGACHSIGPLPCDNNSESFVGFKMASGKSFDISVDLMKKASNFMDSFDPKVNSSDASELTVTKLDSNHVNKSINMEGNRGKDKTNLSLVFMKELKALSALTGSFDDELQALSALKSQSKKQRIPNEEIDSSDTNTHFQGFKRTSGNMLKKPEIPLVASSVNSNLGGISGIKEGFQINHSTDKQFMSKCTSTELNQEALLKLSVEDELDSLIALKNKTSGAESRVCMTNKNSPSVNVVSKNTKPKANVPQGFRPFKPPRIMKPSVKIGAEVSNETNRPQGKEVNYKEKVSSGKLFEIRENCGINVPSHIKENDKECLTGRKSWYDGRREDHISKEEVHDKEKAKPENPCNGLLCKDRTLIQRTKGEETEQKKVVDMQDCYDGLFSQMFADDMEPSELNNVQNSNDSLKTREVIKENIDERDLDKEVKLYHGKNDVTLSKTGIYNGTKIIPREKLAGLASSDNIITIPKSCQTDTGLALDASSEPQGFKTASGKNLSIDPELLSKAASLLDDSATPFMNRNSENEERYSSRDIKQPILELSTSRMGHNRNNKLFKNSEIFPEELANGKEKMDENMVQCADFLKVADKKSEKVLDVSNKTEGQNYNNLNIHIDSEFLVCSSNSAAVWTPCTFKTASGRRVAISEKPLKIACSKFDSLECQKDEQQITGKEDNGKQDEKPCQNSRIGWNADSSQSNASNVDEFIYTGDKLVLAEQMQRTDLLDETQKGSSAGKNINEFSVQSDIYNRQFVHETSNNLDGEKISVFKTPSNRRAFETSENKLPPDVSVSEKQERQIQSSSIHSQSFIPYGACRIENGSPGTDSILNQTTSTCLKAEDENTTEVHVGENITVSETPTSKLSLEQGESLEKYIKDEKVEINKAEPLCLFQTANGKDVSISDKALKEARYRLLNAEQYDLEFKSESPESQMKTTVHFADQKNIVSSEKSLVSVEESFKHFEKHLQEVPSVAEFDYVPPNQTVDKQPVSEVVHDTAGINMKAVTHQKIANVFQTASGKNIGISENALNMATDTFKACGESQVKDCKIVTQSSSLKGTDKAFELSETVLDTVNVSSYKIEDIRYEIPTGSCKFSFQTASGKSVSVSESALQRAQRNWMDEENQTELPAVECYPLFQTASDKSIGISSKALIAAKDNFKQVENEQETPFFGAKPICFTANGKFSDASDRACNFKKGLVLDNSEIKIPKVDYSSCFQTASGKSVAVSEKALNVARNSILKSDENVNSPLSEAKSFLQTATGKNINVSDKALEIAKNSLKDPFEELRLPGTETISKINTSVCETNSLFQTASGKNVTVSEEALRNARNSLNGSGEESVRPEVESKFSFQTARGNKVAVSETALKIAQECLKDSDLDFTIPKNMGDSLFQTASGKSVTVSTKALKLARDCFEISETNGSSAGLPDCDRPVENTETESQNSNSLNQSQNAKQKENVGIDLQKMNGHSLFETASGRNVEITESALSTARKNLLVADEANQSNSITSRVDYNNSGEADRDLGTSLQQLSSLKRSLWESKESKIGTVTQFEADEDDLEQGRRPVKRQRLDTRDGLLDNMLHGLLTDRRSVINRGIKPVHSRTSFKPPARIALNDLTGKDTASKKTTPTKTAFQTPYKTTLTKTSETVPSSETKVTVGAPVFVAKNSNTAASSNTLPYAQRNIPKMKLGGIESVESEKIEQNFDTIPNVDEMLLNAHSNSSAVPNIQSEYKFRNDGKLIDNKQSEEPEVKLHRKLGESLDHDAKIAEENRVEKENVIDCQKINVSGERKVEIQKPALNTLRLTELSNNCKAVSNDAKESGSNKLDTVTHDEEIDFNRMDSCSQDDEAEIFYCNLVEARRKQEELVKQKGMMKVQPSQGRLYRMKQVKGRWKLKDFIQVLRQGCQQSDRAAKQVPVTSATAKEYKFSLKDFYGNQVTHVLVGDGAYLVPDDGGFIGKQEFYSAFVTMNGVDPKLISDAWVYNHYRWIVWKLASYEVVSGSNSCGRYLTPDMLMLQLKYRYDREIDLCERSALKKVYERDDAPGKRMVLCVSGIIRVGETQIGGNLETTANCLDAKMLLELTDGWYSIKAQTDVPLTDLVRKGKITVGQKICVAGAELVGGEDACSPLEAPDSIMLKICCNSCRPASWDSVLGYQLDPRPLCVPITGLYGEGGTVGVIDLIIVRKYPIMYMEKLPGGGCVFRTGKAEEKAQQSFQSKQQEGMEKVYRQIEEEMEKEEKEEKQSMSKKKWSRSEIEYLQSGREIHEALTSSRQPDIIEGLLTEKQICKLMDYKRQLQDEKRQELNSRFQTAWQDRDEGITVRNVTPLLKFRVAGCAHQDTDNKTSTILTVWRPAPEICELQEGKRYKVYNLNTSTARSKYVGHEVQLTATKQTKFQLINIDENFLDNIYEPREVLWASDISRRQPVYGEVDFVGVVVQVSPASQDESFGRQPDTVYCADCQGNLLAIKFWHGVKTYDDSLLTTGSIICCSNLMDKSPYRSIQLPALEASNELSHITNKPQNGEQRQALARLNSALKDKRSFMNKAQSLLASILEKRQASRVTPEKRRYSMTAEAEKTDTTPTKTDKLNCADKETIAMETGATDNLSMSIDSSFEEEISKADLEINCVTLINQQTSCVSEPQKTIHCPDDKAEQGSYSYILEQHRNDSSTVTCNEKMETDQSCAETVKNNIPEVCDEKMDTDLSYTETVESSSHNLCCGSDLNNDNHGAENYNASQTETSLSNAKNSVLSESCQHLFVDKIAPRTDKDLPKIDAKSSQTPTDKANLVVSPDFENNSQITPQTPNSQTPGSQQTRAVYQAKMARLLLYGSPKDLTPVKTPVSRSVSKGFKPPSFVKK